MEQYITAIATIFGTVMATIFTVTAKMNSINKEIFKASEKILNKLDYHEQHDDQRFGNINNQLMELRIINAKYGRNGPKSLHRSTED